MPSLEGVQDGFRGTAVGYGSCRSLCYNTNRWQRIFLLQKSAHYHPALLQSLNKIRPLLLPAFSEAPEPITITRTMPVITTPLRGMWGAL